MKFGESRPLGPNEGRKGITEAQIKLALEANAGVISLAAKTLKCTSQNLRQRINNSAELLAFSQQLDEDVLDLAEAVIKKALTKGDANTARWLLDRRAKKRGYGNSSSVELGGIGGAPIQHAVTEQRADPTTPEEIAAARRRYFDDGDDAGA